MLGNKEVHSDNEQFVDIQQYGDQPAIPSHTVESDVL